MKIEIYALTHKKFSVPPDKTYVPLQVGASTHEDLGYLKDDTQENISDLNCYYSELTGVYWVWKNVKDVDIVGVCHYRRFLLNEQEKVFTASEIEKLLESYDILTSKSLDLNFSYYYGFGENHDRDDLDITMKVLYELYPKFAELFEKRVHENHTYFGNIMICKKELFDEYCSFIFPIFEKMHGMLNLDQYDDYHKRLYGFISEFLLFVWCEYKGLKVKECKVGIIGEKQETKETKQEIDRLLKQKDVAGAKRYFLKMRELRPDILMEASDISGELHLCLEIISICEFESEKYGRPLAPIDKPFKEMIDWANRLNKAALSGNMIDDASEVAVEIANILMNAKKNNIKRID